MADGFAVVDALAADGVDVVLIGVHADSHVGQEAIDLVLGMHPSTVIMVVGSAGDIDVLAPAYVRGARGMLLWETPAHPGTDPTKADRKAGRGALRRPRGLSRSRPRPVSRRIRGRRSDPPCRRAVAATCSCGRGVIRC